MFSGNNRAMSLVSSLWKTRECAIRVRALMFSGQDVCLIITRLECSHVYCFVCLVNHLEATRRQFLRGRCWYQPPREDHVHALQQPLKDPKLYIEALEWVRINPIPNYRCVFCRKTLTRKPIHDFTLQSITDNFGQDREKVPSPEKVHGGIVEVDGFFNKYFLF